MNLSGQYELNASTEKVWEHIVDPYVLQSCIPACQHIEELNTNHATNKAYRVNAVVKFGFIKIGFDVDVKLADMIKPKHYKLYGTVLNGPAKNTNIESIVQLHGVKSGRTTLSYEANANVSHKLISFGEPFIVSITEKWLDRFFATLEDHINA